MKLTLNVLVTTRGEMFLVIGVSLTVLLFLNVQKAFKFTNCFRKQKFKKSFRKKSNITQLTNDLLYRENKIETYHRARENKTNIL